MVINIHAGHNPAGKVACGAVGLINESTENRRVKDEVISQLRELGHTVYDCTVDNGTGQSDVLKKIVAKCNSHTADLDVSVHFNSGAADQKGNGKTTGVEVLIYKKGNAAQSYAKNVADAISELGYTERSDKTSPVNGVKLRPDLYVLKNTKAPAMLIECCFVDDKDDVEKYDYYSMASAIVKGITGQSVQNVPESEPVGSGEETATGPTDALYRVQVGAYSKKGNANAMKEKLKAAGFDAFVIMA